MIKILISKAHNKYQFLERIYDVVCMENDNEAKLWVRLKRTK